MLILPFALMTLVLPLLGLRASTGIASGGAPRAGGDQFFVSPQGNDAWSGTLAAPNAKRTDGPFATLGRARDAVRARRKAPGGLRAPLTVWVRGGTYELRSALALTAEDSGTRAAPITWRAQPGERVTLLGGVAVGGFRAWRGGVYRADVRSLGLEKLARVTEYRNAGDVPHFELFFGGKRMDLARWPNRAADDRKGWAYTAAVTPTASKTQFSFAGDRPAGWKRPEEAQVHIWPWWDWYDQYLGVTAIDAKARTITLSAPTQYDMQPGRRYYVRNVFEELDAPGEWYLDRREGALYFYPPRPLKAGEKATVSVAENVVTLTDVQHVTLRGFTMEGCRGTAVILTNGSDSRVAGCTIRNTGLAGINVLGGFRHTVVGNDIHDTGRTGISVSGGDRKTLTPGGHVVDNNHVHHFGRVLKCYEPGVNAEGVGNRVSHNLIHDGPHAGMTHGGNDHVFEYNDLHHVCMEGSDNGAFYTGRNWSYRGNVLRYNRFHDVLGYGFAKMDAKSGTVEYETPHGAQGIYLDDAVSSFHIYGNILYRVGDRMIQLGGGRDNLIENNIFVDGNPAIGVDARWSKYDWQGTMYARLNEMPYQAPPWSTRYPELAKPMRNHKWPEGNKFFRNISASTTPRPDGFLAFRYMVPSDAVEIDSNLVWNGGAPVVVDAHFLDRAPKGKLPWEKWQAEGFDKNGALADPRFVDPANDDYRLRDDSPAYRLGFRRIPVEKIGLYKDELRASWPVAPDTRRGDTRRGDTRRRVENFPLSPVPSGR